MSDIQKLAKKLYEQSEQAKEPDAPSFNALTKEERDGWYQKARQQAQAG